MNSAAGRATTRRRTVVALTGLLAAAAMTLASASVAAADEDYPLSGHVTDRDHAPLPGIWVYATGPTGTAFTTTDANGDYLLPHLKPATYTLRFEGDDEIIGEYYDGATSLDGATPIVVDAAVTGIDATLARAATLSGAVLDADGAPIDWPGFTVTVSEAASGAWVTDQYYLQGLDYEAGGRTPAYTLRVAPGEYLIRVEPMFATAAATYYGDAELRADAEPVTVGDGEVRSGLDIRVSAGRVISGRISPAIPGTTVWAVDPDTGATGSAPSSGIDAEGDYRIAGVAAGDVVIEAGWSTDYNPGEVGYIGYYGDGRSPAATAPVTLATATPITVAGEDLTGIDVEMVAFGAVGGTITAPFTGVDSVGVTAYRWNGAQWASILESDVTIGDYLLGTWADGPFVDLPAGSYLLGFDRPSGTPEPGYPYCPAFAEDGAAIEIVGGRLSPGIDLTLTKKTSGCADAAMLDGPLPTIAGIPETGATLTADPGTWSPDGTVLAYQWLADGEEITGATGSRLVLGDEQIGAAITVRVSGSRPGYAEQSRTSEATSPVGDGIDPDVTLSATTVHPGEPIEITGAGFAAGEQVRIELHSSPVLLATTTATGGAFVIQVTIPSGTVAGAHSIVLTGSSGHDASIPITVSGLALADTGTAPSGALLLGALLLLGGAGLMIGRRRAGREARAR